MVASSLDPLTRPVESEMPSERTGMRVIRRNWRRAQAMPTRAAEMMMAVADTFEERRNRVGWR